MKQIWIGAAVALMTTSAQAGQVFEFGINGGTARIEIPKNCHDFSCLNLSFTDDSGKGHTAKDLKNVLKNFDSKGGGNADEGKVSDAPVASPFAPHPQNSTAPAGGAAATSKTGTGDPKVRPAAASREPARQAEVTPSKNSAVGTSDDSSSHAADAATAPGADAAPKPVAPPAPAREVVATRAGPAAQPEPKPAATGPIGEWLVEDGSAQVRIEECGPNLCGYVSHAMDETATDSKNPNPALRKRRVIGMAVLIDMKPGKDRWDGKIYNARDGSMYTAHLEMRNPNTLRVEGCAFGGLFCGGQNWKRAL